MCASFIARTKKRVYVRHGLMLETSKGFVRMLLFVIERLTALFSTDILCVSKSVLLRSAQLNLGEKSKSFMLSHGSANGVDTTRFSRERFSVDFISSFKKELGFDPQKKILGFVGRISNDKGIPELIDAWKSILVEMPNVQLMLLGIFDDRDRVSQDVVECITNTPSITLIGFQRDVAPYYAVMDMLILPSYREGMPTVILEASSMQLPIITTRATGCIDAIIENQTGIFTDHTAVGIHDAVKFYIDHPELQKQHGQNGRDFVLANFKQEFIWEELLAKVMCR
jgi:glycosyltransferase involved in cell wall biosynthesis